MKTSELIGPALDWAVTSIEEPEALRYGAADWREQRRSAVIRGEYKHRYHQSWAQGGPIIEREKIDVYCHESPKSGCGWWVAEITGTTAKARGNSYLVAAMRCYVASKLGDEVEIPEELK
jgi:hypothetical protein